MLIKFGKNLEELHNKLRWYKDRRFKRLVDKIPYKFTPNKITSLRLILNLVWLPLVILYPTWWQITIFFLGYYFDLLDGAKARLKNQITYLGEKFDPAADRINHATLQLLILNLINWQLLMLQIFMIWELCLIIWIGFEYFLKNDKTRYLRLALQFLAKFALWIAMLYEIYIVFLI